MILLLLWLRQPHLTNRFDLLHIIDSEYNTNYESIGSILTLTLEFLWRIARMEIIIQTR